MNEEALYSIALARVMPMNSQAQCILLEKLGSAKEVYNHRHSLKDVIPETNEWVMKTLARMDENLDFAEKELEFAEQRGITCLCLGDQHYPTRLRECADAPIILFYRGSADLNNAHVLSIVGTRQCTEYGKRFCQHFLNELATLCPDVLVVSGLAYGIDIAAHRGALACGLPTVAVLAHGLEQIYPRHHQHVAEQMTEHGGVLTEYASYTKIDKVNFVSRNRIVAGLADAVIVVESKERGGALITARIANEYNRDVFALPGRVKDECSAGCNKLIWDNKAMIMPDTAAEFATYMNWKTNADASRPIQREIFPNLTDEEKKIVAFLQKNDEGANLNQLSIATNLTIPRLTSLLFEMEMKGIIKTRGGGLYLLL